MAAREMGLILFLWFVVLLNTPRGEDAFHCDWPRVDGRTLLQQDFDSRYYEREPVVLTHLLGDWPAYVDGRWDEHRILQDFGDNAFNSSHLAPNCRLLSELSDGTLLKHHLDSMSPASWFIYSHHPMNSKMRSRGDYVVPSLLQAVTTNGPQISIGRKMQGNILHDHENNWLAQVRGRKRWLVRPPQEDRYPLVSRAQRMQDGPCSPTPPWPNVTTCVVQDGEIAYIPSYWMHETCNYDTFNIGLAFIGSAPHAVFARKSLDLWMAAVNGDLLSLQGDLGKSDISMKDVLLEPAIRGDHSAVVESLLRWRADVHGAGIQLGEDGVARLPPFQTASISGHVVMSQLLLRHGAEPTKPDSKGLMPMHWAAIHGHVPLLSFLAEHGADTRIHVKSGTPTLTFSAANGHTGFTEHMLLMRADANMKASDGSTPLFAAIQDGRLNVAKILLRHRADVNAWRADGEQPIHVASTNLLKELVPLLVSERAILSSQNREGQEALHIAARFGNLPLLKWLSMANVSLKSPDRDGTTPAFWSAQAGHSGALHFFAKNGIDMNEPISNGFRVLSIAAAEGHAEVVRALLQLDGLERDARSHGRSPIQWAKEGGHSEVVSILSKFSKSKAKRRKKRGAKRSNNGLEEL